MAQLGSTIILGSLSVTDTISIGTPLSIEQGGTGANTVAGARTSLGLGNSAILNTGTAANTVALGNHTHTINLASDSGTSTITLAASSKYKLTAGGNSIIFTTPPNTTYSNFKASGSTASSGLVPSPGSTAGTAKFLREDATWAAPPNDNTWNANSKTVAGYVAASGESAPSTAMTSQSDNWVYGATTSGPAWIKLHANAFKNTTYSAFVKSGASAAAGLVPSPGTTAGTAKYLREDATWATPPNTTYSNFKASGASAAAGLVPSPGTTAGTAKYLREDATWATPPNTTYSAFVKSGTSAAAGLVPKPSTTAGTTKYLREDATWATPPDTDHITTATTTGSGNAVTAISADANGALTVTKGTTFLTSHQTVTNKSATLEWGSSKTIATIGSTDITVSLPASPDTDTIAVCSTVATTAAKVANLKNFKLSNGQNIILYLSYTNTVSSPTLNINSTGAKTIRVNGASVTSKNLPKGFYRAISSESYWDLYTMLSETSSIINQLTNSIKLSNGLMIQWGFTDSLGNVGPGVAKSVTVNFTSGNGYNYNDGYYSVQVTQEGSTSGMELSIEKNSDPKTGFKIIGYNRNSSSTINNVKFHWLTIGSFNS